MENQNSFELETVVANWRKELAGQNELSVEVLRELEAHLRDAVAEFQKQGHGDKESFALARRRIGDPRQLAREFRKGDVRPWNWRMTATAAATVLICFVWGWSYHKKHSLDYHWGTGSVSVLADHGLFEFGFRRRDFTAEAGEKAEYTTGWFFRNSEAEIKGIFPDPGFEWDGHRRGASSGWSTLKMWGAKQGMSGFLARHGFAAWRSDFGVGMFGPTRGIDRLVFAPFWFLAVLAAGPGLIWWVLVPALLARRRHALAPFGATKPLLMQVLKPKPAVG